MTKIFDMDKQPESLRTGHKIHTAIQFAVWAHSGQKRRDSNIDYISHPMEVLQILAEIGAPTDVQIAGVLHDTIEDCENITKEIIAEFFGDKVALLVQGHSQNKNKTWKQRKESAIRIARMGSFQENMITLADKVSNLRSMVADYEDIGEDLWLRFHAGKQEVAWYYGSMQDALHSMNDYKETHALYREMIDLYKALFVYYFYDEKDRAIYQTDFNTCSCFTTGELQWENCEMANFEHNKFAHLMQEEAEKLEAEWMSASLESVDHCSQEKNENEMD